MNPRLWVLLTLGSLRQTLSRTLAFVCNNAAYYRGGEGLWVIRAMKNDPKGSMIAQPIIEGCVAFRSLNRVA